VSARPPINHAQPPDVADEPVASLDPSTSTGVLDLLHGIARSEGVAVVCSLHQVHLARAYADRIVVSGHVVFDLPAAGFDENAFRNRQCDLNAPASTRARIPTLCARADESNKRPFAGLRRQP
jgi:phosphonate transport system ATP-binding protein